MVTQVYSALDRVWDAQGIKISFAQRSLAFRLQRGAAILALAASSCTGIPQTVTPVCQLPRNAVSISLTSGSQGVAEIPVKRTTDDSKHVESVLHVSLRNEGFTQPTQLCGSAELTNVRGKPQPVLLAFSESEKSASGLTFDQHHTCLTLQPPWGPFKESSIDLNLRADPDAIPLTGTVNLSANVTAKEPPVAAEDSKSNGNRPDLKSATPVDCISSSKLVAKSIMLVPPDDSCWFKLPLLASLGIGLVYLLFSLWALRGKLGTLVGGPQWSFGTSFATNFTVGAGLLTPLLGVSVTSDALHYMTKSSYTLLALLFAALLLIAPALFSFFSVPRQIISAPGQTTTTASGSVRLFLVTSALMIVAVAGQLITVGLAIGEVKFRGSLNWPAAIFIFCLLVTAGVGTIVVAVRTLNTLLKALLPPAQDSYPPKEHLGDIAKKIASAHLEAAVSGDRPNLFTAEDRQAVQHVMGLQEPMLQSWKMY